MLDLIGFQAGMMIRFKAIRCENSMDHSSSAKSSGKHFNIEKLEELFYELEAKSDNSWTKLSELEDKNIQINGKIYKKMVPGYDINFIKSVMTLKDLSIDVASAQ